MKKVALSFLALLAAGSMAFAADLPTTSPLNASVSAEGSTTFTYDLGGAGWGVANAASASIRLDFVGNTDSDSDVAKGSTDKAGKISANFRLGIIAGAVEQNASLDYAKIVLGDLYIKIAGVTDPSVGYTGDITYFDANLVDGSSIKLADPIGAASAQTSGAGYEIGYSIPKVVDLTFGLGVDTNTVGTAHSFEYSAVANVTAVDKLTLMAGYLGGTATGASSGIVAKLGYDAGIVALTAAYDMVGTASGLTVEAVAPVMDGFKVSVAALPLATTLDAIAKISVGDKLLGVGTLDVGYQLNGTKVYADLELTKLVDILTAYVKVQYVTDVDYAVGFSTSKLIDNVTFSGELNSTKGTAGQIALTAKIAL